MADGRGQPLLPEKWLENVSAEARALGFDGVVLDDVNESGSTGAPERENDRQLPDEPDQ